MNLSPLPIQKFFDNNGRPLDGGLLFTYATFTSTKIATYKNAAGTLNTNPIELDFRGECRLWIDPTLSYTFVLAPANDTDPPTNPIWTVDNITAGPAQQDNAADDTGSVNNIELSIPQISSPVAFTRIVFKAANTNTGQTTISINGGTAKDLTWQNIGAFSGGEIQENGIYAAVFDGAQWQLQSPALMPTLQLAPAEIAAGLTVADIVDWSYPVGVVDRYKKNTTPGTTDMTEAVQTAADVCKTDRLIVAFLAAEYLITDTILLYRGSNLRGETTNQFFAGFGVLPKGTTITFEPASSRSLFEFQSGSAFVFHCSIGGMNIEGTGGTNCLYAIDCDWVIYGNFYNLAIDGFDSAIRCYHTIQNRFENILASGDTYDVLYDGGSCTTDTWHQCTFFGGETGVRFVGSNLAIRFSDCNFEQCENYGVEIDKDCQSIIFDECYCEDVPFTNNSAGAMFKVGHSGTSLVVENAIIVNGGVYQGRSAGTVGSFFDSDYMTGAMVGMFNVSRFTNVFKASANTRAKSIVMGGFSGISFTNLFADATTVAATVGMYATAPLSTAGATQSLRCASIDTSADITSGGLLVSNFSACVKDGISEPSTFPGFAQIYVDTADGSLKVKFGDGSVALIVANPP